MVNRLIWRNLTGEKGGIPEKVKNSIVYIEIKYHASSY